MKKIEIIEDLDSYAHDFITTFLSDEDKELLSSYSDISLSKEISDYLLKGQIDNDSIIYMKQKIDNINKIINMFSIPNDITVYHGGLIKVSSNQRHIKLKTFLSTTLDYETAYDFAYQRTFNKWTNEKHKLSDSFNMNILKIHLPSGYPALWMKPYSLVSAENELVISNDSMFDITKVEDKGNVKIISLRP